MIVLWEIAKTKVFGRQLPQHKFSVAVKRKKDAMSLATLTSETQK